MQASARPDACSLLGVPDSLGATVVANTRLWAAPTRPVAEIYTGVLYAALGLSRLDVSARRRARSRLVVISALWGAVRMHDKIPSYRLSMTARLPGIDGLAATWRPELDRVLPLAASAGLIIDCRSSSYAQAWRPMGIRAPRWVEVNVFTEQAGRRVLVSHMAKHTRGLVARQLLGSAKDPRRPSSLPGLLAGWRTELMEPTRQGQPWMLNVLIG